MGTYMYEGSFLCCVNLLFLTLFDGFDQSLALYGVGGTSLRTLAGSCLRRWQALGQPEQRYADAGRQRLQPRVPALQRGRSSGA